MEEAERIIAPVTISSSALLLLNERYSGISYSELIDQSIYLGCSFQAMDGCNYLAGNSPWLPPAPAPLTEETMRLYRFYILPSHHRRWENLADQLNLDMPAALDWCIRLWSEVQTQRLLMQPLICVLPNGRQIPANFDAF